MKLIASSTLFLSYARNLVVPGSSTGTVQVEIKVFLHKEVLSFFLKSVLSLVVRNPFFVVGS